MAGRRTPESPAVSLEVALRLEAGGGGLLPCVSYDRLPSGYRPGTRHSCRPSPRTSTGRGWCPGPPVRHEKDRPHGSDGNLETDGCWGPRVNATLKRVLFGMLLVVVGVLVRNASTAFPAHERPVAFSDFMADVDSGKVEQVTITGHMIAGLYRTNKQSFQTYAPSQYQGLANTLPARGI